MHTWLLFGLFAGATASRVIFSCSGAACDKAVFPEYAKFATFHNGEIRHEFYSVPKNNAAMVDGKPGWRSLALYSNSRVFLPNQIKFWLSSCDNNTLAEKIVHDNDCIIITEKQDKCSFIAEVPWYHLSTIFELIDNIKQQSNVIRAELVEWLA